MKTPLIEAYDKMQIPRTIRYSCTYKFVLPCDCCDNQFVVKSEYDLSNVNIWAQASSRGWCLNLHGEILCPECE
jgi:hypothetical protein